MFFKKYGDIVVGVFFMILSTALMVMAKMLPKSKVMEIGPDFMPMVLPSFWQRFSHSSVLKILRCMKKNWRML